MSDAGSPLGQDDDLFALMDVLARRHCLPLITMLRTGARSYATLVSSLGSAASVVSQRLRELRAGGLVEVDEAGDYRLTSYGRRLLGPLDQLAVFAREWSSLSPRQRTPRGSATHARGER